jgi:HEAT repeat protein
VVHALSKIGDSRAVEALVVALKDADSKVRTAAVEALGRFGDAHAIDPLVRLLSDSNWDVRAAVVEALGRFKERRVAEALLPVLKDNDPDIRRLAAAALGKMGDPMAIEGLVLTLKDEQEPVRQAAEASLMKIDRNWESSESARRAIPALQDALKSHEYWVRTCAASVLKRIVGEEQAATVDDNTVIADRATYLKQEGAVVLIQALRDEDRDVRQAAAEALGRLGHKPAIEALALVLQDEDEWVRHAAANALEGLNWQPADEVLRARHAVVLQRWDAAVVLGGAAMGPLLQASVSGDGITRYRAAMCLGQLGDARAVPALASLLSDTYQPVRQAAAQALVAVGLCHATPKQQAAAAVELREWDKAINLGADAVEAMADAVRKRNEDPEWSAAAAVSLAQVTDPAAFTPLLALLGDPEVAAESLQSLETLLQLSAEGIETAHLERAIDLGSVFYDRYELEEITKMALKVGTEELDTTRLKVLARMELDRRGVGASTHSTTT